LLQLLTIGLFGLDNLLRGLALRTRIVQFSQFPAALFKRTFALLERLGFAFALLKIGGVLINLRLQLFNLAMQTRQLARLLIRVFARAQQLLRVLDLLLDVLEIFPFTVQTLYFALLPPNLDVETLDALRATFALLNILAQFF